MKAVKIIVGVVVVLVAAFLIIAAIAPTHTHVERSMVIDAPMDFVHPQVSSFENMKEWSPWTELDPNQTFEHTGESGTVGSKYSWAGNEEVGKGEQEMLVIEANHIATKLRFIEPFESEADATYDLEETEGGTKVTWGFDSETPFPMNAMNFFMDMDAMLGPDFEKGLNNLQERVSAMKAERNEFDGYTVNTEDMPAMTVVGVRETIGWEEMSSFFATNFPMVFESIGKAGMEPAGVPCSVTFLWDEENQQADVLAGMPLAEGSLEGMETAELGGNCLVVDYYGNYDESVKAHEAIAAYMEWHGMEMNGPVVEQYITDPETEEDPSKWLTKIIYHVKS